MDKHMDWFDRFQSKLGQWYQSHFGVGEDSELTPKDVLRKIIEAMEEFRSEGLDGRIYVPNRYVLELAVMNAEERAYLLSFLDEEELSTVLERYMALKNYFTRGPLDFTIEELEAIPGEEKLYVRALFDKDAPGRAASAAQQQAQPAPKPAAPSAPRAHDERIADEPTVDVWSKMQADEPATVHAPPTAWAVLLVESIDGRRSLVSINKPVFCVGRSRHTNNDLVLAEDGQVSKRHLRIELEPDGGATLYDLASTNGTFVNGKLIPVNTVLKRGDVIEIGQTRMEFQRENDAAAAAFADAEAHPPTVLPPAEAAPYPQPVSQAPQQTGQPAQKVARLTRIGDNSVYMLGSEALIGRSMTCDIVLSESTVSTQQARVHGEDGRYTVQDLSGRGTTIVNGRPARTGERIPVASGDRLNLGGIAFQFTIE